MKVHLALGPILTLSACDLAYSAASVDRFEVEVERTSELTAEVRLCGREEAMDRTANGFRSRFKIDCEGSGEIIVRETGADERTCMIGYVTPNAGQRFRFRLTEKSCEPIPGLPA